MNDKLATKVVGLADEDLEKITGGMERSLLIGSICQQECPYKNMTEPPCGDCQYGSDMTTNCL
ncbi:hypothetical protein [Acetobacterium woodii]|uniref:Uncharacterized protein n=1 Tax=Acetobacterium woodii (strain ATCC 29683 / DSM 1030 / JCM 2381 / KCTC 1655 / WB1) TaxID=931626 RepID=H6LJM2_ACEWD|nr:hypothetical protein [Acetobacterium woodii]AFA49950.1 hypothetical protein Awo_c32220 [Acetobacterium woodii DSM 1030]